ncbi:MFS transporter [Amycolatopsis tucumanensis]|uniref:Aromatic acid/H+ symport family MFS transporter n=1 Tax=Amycolatopsis tucumanensis TaxID=401106 RepID=A0ABP7HSS2_9PSEU|nr:MFS transporter [Amycolatopsis tucumanensis]MCF6421369.1 MFS transporter [Amycolatopsis tucumanensis]
MPSSPPTVRLPQFLDDRPLGRLQYGVLTLCGLVMFLDGFDTQAISYAAPAIARDWHLPSAAFGPVFSAALIGLMIGYLVISPLADRVGRRTMIVAATTAFSVLTLLTVFAQSVEALFVIRLLTGIPLGAATPSAIALTSEYAPKRLRATFVLVIYCGYSLGFVVAGAVSGALIPVYGWHSVFLVGGIAPVLLVPLLWRRLPESPTVCLRRGRPVAHLLRRLDPSLPQDVQVLGEPAEATHRVPLARLFSHRWVMGTLLLWAAFTINLAVFYALQSWLPTLLGKAGYSPSAVVAATTLTTVGGIAAAVVIGPAMDWIGAAQTLGALYLVGFVSVGFLGFALDLPLWVVLVVNFVAGCCVSGGQKSVSAYTSMFYPTEMRSTGVGWGLGVGRVGGIFGPIAVGVAVSAGWSDRSLFMAVAVPLLIGAVLVLALPRSARRATAAEPLPQAASEPSS